MTIKRNEFLKPLSRDHHYGLLLCWKIRMGIKKGIEPERIKKYAGWYYQHHLIPHFEVEEKYVFSILGNEHELIKKAMAEHRRLKRLFEFSGEVLRDLSLIEEELESHIRFEERILFNEIQAIANAKQLAAIQQVHSHEKVVDNVADMFWE